MNRPLLAQTDFRDLALITMHLYDSNIPSGNVYKVNLVLAFLGLPYQTTELDILATPSETRKPEFLAMNPNGRVPVLRLDDADGTVLAESNAILFYLAEGTKYLPNSKIGRARVLQWMFFEQYSHEPYVAVMKYCTYWGGFAGRSPGEIEKLKARGQAAIDVMETHLEGKTFFVEETVTIADVALYAYTQSAEHLGYKVGPNVKAWLERVRGQEGYVQIKKDPLGKAP